MRKRYKDDQKRFFLSLYRKSGKTQTEFAKDHGLNPKTLSRWVRVSVFEGAERESFPRKCGKQPSVFLPVLLQDDESAAGAALDDPHLHITTRKDVCLSLHCKGFVLEIPSTMDAKLSIVSKMIQLLHKL